MGKKLETIKAVAGFGVAVGAGVIVANAVKATTPVQVNKLAKVLIHLGEFGIAGYVGEKAADYTTEQIDAVAAVFGAGKAVINNATFQVNDPAAPADQTK